MLPPMLRVRGTLLCMIYDMLVGVEFSSGAPSSIAGFLDFLAEVYKALGHELDAAKTDVHNHAATKTGT